MAIRVNHIVSVAPFNTNNLWCCWCGATAFTGSLQNSPWKLRVGTFENIGLAPTIGYVDEFKLWGRALTANEILYIYNDGNLENGIYTDINGSNSSTGSLTILGGITGSLNGTASALAIDGNYQINNLTASGIQASDIIMKNMIIFPDDAGDVLIFEDDSALIVSSSGGSVGMGNGICFADLSFQTPGLSTQGFFDNSQTPSRVTVWNPAFPALSSSVTTITEVETLHGISSSVKLQTQIDGKQAFLPTASISPSNATTIVGWVNITVQGTLFWMPLYK